MRDYSKVSPRFWTGDTGRQIRKLGPECQVVAFYLFTCPSANMLGLYYLILPTLCHETGIPLEGAFKALRSLRDIGFAYYDESTEHVYVPNMAREQIGERLKTKDNRHVAVLRELEQLRKTPFFNDFVNRYREAFELESVDLVKPLPSPFGGSEQLLRSQEQEQEHEQEQKQKKEIDVQSDDARTESGKPAEQKRIESAAITRVFEHWQSVHGHARAKLDAKRRKLIARALATYNEVDLCQCIAGYRNSPYHMGKNETGTTYDDIELMLRDAKHIDAGIRFHADPPRSDLSAQTRRIIDQTEDWVPPEVRNGTR